MVDEAVVDVVDTEAKNNHRIQEGVMCCQPLGELGLSHSAIQPYVACD